ncbi:MAG: DotH/IcmK family type IV secretion protein [Desulfovibrio sp.]|nr:DotH/IcmK family type IV secretion protein [Desulfovibrio sp.]
MRVTAHGTRTGLLPPALLLLLSLLALLLSLPNVSYAREEIQGVRKEESLEYAVEKGEGATQGERGISPDMHESRDAGPSAELLERLLRERDLREAMDRSMPLRASEILEAKKEREAMLDAGAPEAALMHTESRSLPLTPSGIPQIIRLTRGYASTLLFFDRTGSPWPITHVVLGNEKAFQIVRPQAAGKEVSGRMRERGERRKDGEERSRASAPKRTHGTSLPSRRMPQTSDEHWEDEASEEAVLSVESHVLTVLPLLDRANANLAIGLEGVPYPVIVQLLTDSPLKENRASDALVAFRLEGRGPLAKKMRLSGSGSAGIRDDLLPFLHGLPPAGAKERPLSPAPNGTELWEYGDDYVLRSPHTLLWPCWKEKLQTEGAGLYLLPKTASLVLSVSGKSTDIRVGSGESSPFRRIRSRRGLAAEEAIHEE